MKKIKFEMDQNMAALVVGSFANMIGAILDQHRNYDNIDMIGEVAVLRMPYGGHLTMKELPQVVVHKIQIMANLSAAFGVPEWQEIAYACQEKAISEGVLPKRAPGGPPPPEKGGGT